MSHQCPFPVHSSDNRCGYRAGSAPGFTLSLALVAALSPRVVVQLPGCRPGSRPGWGDGEDARMQRPEPTRILLTGAAGLVGASFAARTARGTRAQGSVGRSLFRHGRWVLCLRWFRAPRGDLFLIGSGQQALWRSDSPSPTGRRPNRPPAAGKDAGRRSL